MFNGSMYGLGPYGESSNPSTLTIKTKEGTGVKVYKLENISTGGYCYYNDAESMKEEFVDNELDDEWHIKVEEMDEETYYNLPEHIGW